MLLFLINFKQLFVRKLLLFQARFISLLLQGLSLHQMGNKTQPHHFCLHGIYSNEKKAPQPFAMGHLEGLCFNLTNQLLEVGNSHFPWKDLCRRQSLPTRHVTSSKSAQHFIKE